MENLKTIEDQDSGFENRDKLKDDDTEKRENNVEMEIAGEMEEMKKNLDEVKKEFDVMGGENGMVDSLGEAGPEDVKKIFKTVKKIIIGAAVLGGVAVSSLADSNLFGKMQEIMQSPESDKFVYTGLAIMFSIAIGFLADGVISSGKEKGLSIKDSFKNFFSFSDKMHSES